LDASVEAIESFTITELKEQAREVIDLVAVRKAIAILRHRTPEAVLIPVDDYIELVKLRRERLNVLTQRYDEMVSRMRTPEAAAGVDALFNATPEELGRAAVKAAKRG
jgi:prevent-host-death family protein